MRGRYSNCIKLKRLLDWHFKNIRGGRIIQEYGFEVLRMMHARNGA